MLEIPVIRWGKPYESLEKADVVHFETGEVMAKMHQANAGLVQMDSRKSAKAREILKQFSIADLIKKCEQAADFYLTANLPMGTGTQTPEEFCSIQSATTGLPLNMCRANMSKNAFVLKHMGDMLDALTRGLSLDILSRGYGMESRNVMVSFQATTPTLGLVSAVEFAGCSYAVAACDSAADRTGSETGVIRTVDSVSHVRSICSSRRSARSLLFVSGATRRR